MGRRQLLIFDLDETLVFSSFSPQKCGYDFTVSDGAMTYYVKKRPNVDSFLRWAALHFTLAVWSASGRVYVKKIVQEIFAGISLLFAWSGERCTNSFFYDEWKDLHRHVVLKDLKKVWRRKDFPYGRSDTLVLDNTPETYSRNYGNALEIEDFTGAESDDALSRVRDKLEKLLGAVNVRTIDKRRL